MQNVLWANPIDYNSWLREKEGLNRWRCIVPLLYIDGILMLLIQEARRKQ